MQNGVDYIEITQTAAMRESSHGVRAKCLQRLIRLDMPVPKTMALNFDTVQRIASGQHFDSAELLSHFGPDPLITVRPSPEMSEWGGPGAVLDIGMNDAQLVRLSEKLGSEAARSLYLRFIHNYAVEVARLDPEEFPIVDHPSTDALRFAHQAYLDEMDEPFPQDPAEQLTNVLRSMARAWDGTSARLLRQARGAPENAGLGLVVQEMSLGMGAVESGAGLVQFVSSTTGAPQITGRYMRQSVGGKALKGDDAVYLASDPRGPALQDIAPDAMAELTALSDRLREGLKEEMQVAFSLTNSRLNVLDAVKVPRSPRAAVRIAVDLAERGVISREDALLRVEPRALSELLHRQVSAEVERDPIARGMAASPGAATGKIVFTANAAQEYAARDEACILVRRETSPEDIRGMHSAKGVLTERGGMSSHAAVIARGLGVPCVVGADEISINARSKSLTLADGSELQEGDVITLDGSSGDVLAGAVPLEEAALDQPFRTLMGWADDARDIDVRANADTPADAQTAQLFEAKGIGLCRTEHMFFDEGRLTLMREMIFAQTEADRAASLARLLPMQRADFLKLFETMRGLPVCIRLFDPPLHEFLPHSRDGMRALAEALDLPQSVVTHRVAELQEFNPMLGMRGVRLGITMPEIYDMQARAIFEATVQAAEQGATVVPEVMIPLVSAKREVELVRARIDATAAEVRSESGQDFTYRLGVMVETPRAALRAGDIAGQVDFLSFGTNDLTQMSYGLSRDDAGRFMGEYVNQGVFPEDPFHTLDVDGVGELLTIAASRGREVKPGLTLSVCGEHGGDPDSIDFCRKAGFTYVSCSPFRVPVARLAAAHLALTDAPSVKNPRRFNLLGRVFRAS